MKTPSGSPAWRQSSAQNIAADGSRSLGLSTKVFPHAIAIGYIHIGTIAGKLNGVIAGDDAERLAHRVDVDVGRHVLASSPLISSGMPHANSMTSRPRWTSPSASDGTLPCSRVRWAAISSLLRSTSSRNANMIRPRCASEVRRQAGSAALAAATASSTTAGDANATRAWTLPVAGS